MNYTAETVPAEHGPNPMTAFAMVAEVGDTFAAGGVTYTATAVAPHGPYTAVTFSGAGTEWTQDYKRP